MKATPPNGVSVTAACGLVWMGAAPRYKRGHVDLAKEVVDLDGDPSVDVPYAQLYLKVELTLSGIVRFEPGNAGDIWFETELDPNFSLLQRHMATMKFGRGNDTAFAIPEAIANEACATATAKIRVKDFVVNFEIPTSMERTRCRSTYWKFLRMPVVPSNDPTA